MQSPSESDAALVAAARAGDRLAFGQLIDRRHNSLRLICARTLGDLGLADDAAQEAVLHAMLELNSLRKPNQFGAWLIGIGLNVCRRWLRARTTDAVSWEALTGGSKVHEPMDALTPDPAVAMEEFELARRVRDAVDALPIGQRAAVLLFYLAGLSHSETAAALGIPIGAVKTRLHKARGNLRRELLDLWKESHAMSQATSTDYVDVSITDVRRVLPAEGKTVSRNVVLLQEQGASARLLPIWIGSFEAESLLMALVGREVPRPLTFTFANSVLEAAGGQLKEVRIHQILDETYYAETVIQGPDGKERSVDSRPSDAMSLALVKKVPIRVGESVMATCGVDAAGLGELPAADGRRVQSMQDILADMDRRRIEREADMAETLAKVRERRGG